MNVDSQFVEQIVTAVLDRIRDGRAAARGTSAAVPSGATPSPANAAKQSDVCVLDVPVLTAAVLHEQLGPEQFGGARRVQVGAKTVLTPSARDYLRTGHIVWTRGPAGTGSTAGATKWKGLAVTATAALQRLCEEAGAGMGLTACEWLGSTDEAVDQAVAALARAEVDGMVLFTSQTARAVCRANRHDAVRAAWAGTRHDVEAIRAQLGANLYVISPSAKSYFELRNLARAATSGGAPRVPKDWKH